MRGGDPCGRPGSLPSHIQPDVIGMAARAEPRAQKAHQTAYKSHHHEKDQRGNQSASDVQRIAAEDGIDLAWIVWKLFDYIADNLRDCARHEATEEAEFTSYRRSANNEPGHKVNNQPDHACQQEQP